MKTLVALPMPLALIATVGSPSVAAQVALGPSARLVTSAAAQSVPDLPILGLAQVSIRVSNLARSRRFYHDVLGLPEAFDLKDRSGRVVSAYFRVNDEQYLELLPDLSPGDLRRQARLIVEASDLDRLHALYAARGLRPGPIARGPDGNPVFRILAPNGLPVDFLQYAPGSRQRTAHGGPTDPEPISTHLLHAGAMVTDDATRAFFAGLGWGRTLPGLRGDYIETPSSDRNLETKNPPLDPADPATRARYEQELSGAVNHVSLEIVDMHAARETLKRRGGYDDVRLRTAVGNNRHWLLHLFDPDGTRVELMSRDTVDPAIPAFSVMPPGPPGPPILAAQRGVYPWP